ncbi:MAG: hypothetical protein J7K47_06280 [Thermoplasmata archaeon]|nr:hypothetical protein [Thermoplasmata archaeon]
MELKSVVACPPAHEYYNVRNADEHNIREVATKEAIKHMKCSLDCLRRNAKFMKWKNCQRIRTLFLCVILR